MPNEHLSVETSEVPLSRPPEVATDEASAAAPPAAPNSDKPSAAAKPAATTDDAPKPDKDKGAEPDGEDQPDAAARRRANDPEKRIAKLTRNWRDAERRAAYLQGQLDAQKRGTDAGPAAPPAPPATDPEPQPDDFETIDEFRSAMKDWAVRNREQLSAAAPPAKQGTAPAKPGAPAPASSTAPGREPSAAEIESYRANQERHEDFDEVMADLALPLDVTQRLLGAVEDMDPFNVIYHLAKDPESVERISKLSPRQQEREVWKLAEKLAATPPAPETDKTPTAAAEDADESDEPRPQPKPAVSRSSPPPNPISGSSALPETDLAHLAETDISKYMDTMNKRDRARGVRY